MVLVKEYLLSYHMKLLAIATRIIIIPYCQNNSKKLRITVMEDVYYFTLISGGKLARDHLSICSKYLGKPEKKRGREWGQKAQTKYVEKT